MHAPSFLALVVLAAGSFAASISSLDASQSKAILRVWSAYSATVGFDSSVASLVDAVATAVPSSDVAHTTATATTTSAVDLVSYLNNPPKISTPSWISDMPKSLATPYLALLTSVEDAMVSLGKEAATETVSAKSTTSTSTASSASSSLASASSTMTSTMTTTTSGSSAAAASSSSAASASAASTGAAAAAPMAEGLVRALGLAAGAVGAVALLL